MNIPSLAARTKPRSHRRAMVLVPAALMIFALTACEPESVRYQSVHLISSPAELGSDVPEPEPEPQPESVEDLIGRYFGSATGQALKIVRCESNFNPAARSPTNDHGLFQINRVHRNMFPQVTGRPWSDVYDAEANTIYAKHLYDSEGWRPWTCRKAL